MPHKMTRQNWNPRYIPPKPMFHYKIGKMQEGKCFITIIIPCFSNNFHVKTDGNAESHMLKLSMNFILKVDNGGTP